MSTLRSVFIEQLVLVMLIVCLSNRPATGQEPSTDGQMTDESIPPGTALAQIKNTYEARRKSSNLLPTDQEDKTPLPTWFRQYLRDQLKLVQIGPYQYPRAAEQVFDWMLAHPDLKVGTPSPEGAESRAAAVQPELNGNINVTNHDERNSESSIAIDYANPKYLVAASNNIKTSGRQKQFYSSDGGATWNATELPLAEGKALHSDPAVAFDTAGTVWASTIGVNNTGSSLQIQVYKSLDHGASWTFVSTISSGGNNDKEMMVIDTDSRSPFKDHIYVAWDVPGKGMRFSLSNDKGGSWTGPKTLSDDSAIGAALVTGPKGELLVGWPDVTSRKIYIKQSIDGGKTFSAKRTVASTTAAYEIRIPPMCRRNALVYLSLGIDRSKGARAGTVYAAWTDLQGTGEPGCNGKSGTGNAGVYFSLSKDGGKTWAAPRMVGKDQAHVDRFNQWLDVDPEDGSVYVLYYGTTGDDSRHSTNVYLANSSDGGKTWSESKLSSAPTDETSAGADLGNQYGDYNGLVAYRHQVHASWTDRRTVVPAGKEQIFTNATAKQKE